VVSDFPLSLLSTERPLSPIFVLTYPFSILLFVPPFQLLQTTRNAVLKSSLVRRHSFTSFTAFTSSTAFTTYAALTPPNPLHTLLFHDITAHTASLELLLHAKLGLARF